MWDGAAAPPRAPAPRPLPLPRLTRAQQARANALHRPRAALRFALGGREAVLRGAEDFSARPEGDCQTLRLRIGAESATLRCSAALVGLALRALDPGLRTGALPPDLAALLLQAAAEAALDAWESAAGLAVGIGPAADGAPAPRDRVTLLVEAGGAAWPVELAAETEGALDAILRPWPVAPRRLDDFPLHAAVRLGATRLDAGMLASLAPGDAVLLEMSAGASSAGRLVAAEAWTAPVARSGGGWRLEAAPRRDGDGGGWTMTQAAPDGDGFGEAADDIPVTLVFEAGRRELTLGELRRLAPGAVLDLGRGASEPIDIRANGRRIGSGELVEIDGALAVRVLRIFANG